MTEQITAEQAEAYVRERWEWLIVRKRDDRDEWEWFGSIAWQASPTLANSEPDAWLAAYAYTKAHERKIAEKREEIKAISDWTAYLDKWDIKEPAAQRILAILEAQLADLLKGWRQQ